MSVKTVYVPEEDRTLWEQLGVLAARERTSSSKLVHEAIGQYLRNRAIRDAAEAVKKAQENTNARE